MGNRTSTKEVLDHHHLKCLAASDLEDFKKVELADSRAESGGYRDRSTRDKPAQYFASRNDTRGSNGVALDDPGSGDAASSGFGCRHQWCDGDDASRKSGPGIGAGKGPRREDREGDVIWPT